MKRWIFSLIFIGAPSWAQTFDYVGLVQGYQTAQIKTLAMKQSEIVGTPWKLMATVSRIEEVQGYFRDYAESDFFVYLNLIFFNGGTGSAGAVLISHSELDFVEQPDMKNPILVHTDHVTEQKYQIVKNTLQFNGPTEFIPTDGQIKLSPFACSLVDYQSKYFLICEFLDTFHNGKNHFSGRFYHVLSRDIL